MSSPLFLTVSTLHIDNDHFDIDNDNRQTTIPTMDIDNDSGQPTANDNNNDACNDRTTHDLEANFSKRASSPSCTVAGKAWRKPGPKEHLAREGDATCRRHAPTPKVVVLGCTLLTKTRSGVPSCATPHEDRFCATRETCRCTIPAGRDVSDLNAPAPGGTLEPRATR